MDPKNLNAGWTAFVALVVGFGAMVPFMNTGPLVGPVAKGSTERICPSMWAL